MHHIYLESLVRGGIFIFIYNSLELEKYGNKFGDDF
jgi:hypothetical protein